MTTFRADDQGISDAGRLAIVELARECRTSGEMNAAHVLRLTRRLLDGRAITREEADALFDIDAAAYPKCPQWTECLVEAITDHVVWQCRPTGILNSEQAEWLLGKCDRSGSTPALATLVNVAAEADRVPVWFVAAVRGRVARAWPALEATLAQAQAQSSGSIRAA